MGAEFLVLAGDHGARERWRDALERHPLTMDRRAVERADEHERSDRRRDETVGDDKRHGKKKQDQRRPEGKPCHTPAPALAAGTAQRAGATATRGTRPVDGGGAGEKRHRPRRR